MSYYGSLAELRSRMSGDVPVISGAWDETIIDIIGQTSDLIDEEVRNVRGQAPGWSFLPPALYGAQLVSVSGGGSGTFTLTFSASTTSAIASGASAAVVQTALDAILGAGNSVVAGAPGGPWTVTFAGTLSGPQPTFLATSTFTPATSHAVVETLSVGSAATVTRRYTGAAGGSALVLIDDAVAVSAVTVLDSAGAVSQALVAGTDYLPSPLQGTPITGLMLINDVWPWYPGGVQVTLTPGFGPTLPANIRRATLAESIRALRGAQAGEDDRLGMTPYGSVVVSKALLASTLLACQHYRYGGSVFRG